MGVGYGLILLGCLVTTEAVANRAQLGPGVNAFYAELDGVLVNGKYDNMRDWMQRTVAWTIENQAIIAAQTIAMLTEGEPPQALLSPTVEVMPLLRWSAGIGRPTPTDWSTPSQTSGIVH